MAETVSFLITASRSLLLGPLIKRGGDSVITNLQDKSQRYRCLYYRTGVCRWELHPTQYFRCTRFYEVCKNKKAKEGQLARTPNLGHPSNAISACKITTFPQAIKEKPQKNHNSPPCRAVY